MAFRPGQVFIEQGNPQLCSHRLIQKFTGSWYVHGYVAISETVGVEASIPRLPSWQEMLHGYFNTGRVVMFDIADRLAWVKSYDGQTVVLDLPGITDDQRHKVAETALSYVGWKYDLISVLLYPLLGFWPKLKRKELFCSELMARMFRDGLGQRIFTEESLDKVPTSQYYRLKNLRDGLCTPDEVMRYSELVEVDRIQ
jgi:hypothetical protein